MAFDDELRAQRDAGLKQSTTPTTQAAVASPPVATVPVARPPLAAPVQAGTGPRFAPGELQRPPLATNVSLLPEVRAPALAPAAAPPPSLSAVQAAGTQLDTARAALTQSEATPLTTAGRIDAEQVASREATKRAAAAARSQYESVAGAAVPPAISQGPGGFNLQPQPAAMQFGNVTGGASTMTQPVAPAAAPAAAPLPTQQAAPVTAAPAPAAAAATGVAAAPPPVEYGLSGGPSSGSATFTRPDGTKVNYDVSGGMVMRDGVRVPRNVGGAPAVAAPALAGAPAGPAVARPALGGVPGVGGGGSAEVSAALNAAAARGDFEAVRKHYQDQQGGTYMGKEAWQEKPDLTTPAGRRAFAAQQKQVEATRLGKESEQRLGIEATAEARRGRESTARIGREATAESRMGRETDARIQEMTGRQVLAMNADQRAQAEANFKQVQHNAQIRLAQGGLSPDEEARQRTLAGVDDKWDFKTLKGDPLTGIPDRGMLFNKSTGQTIDTQTGETIYEGSGKAGAKPRAKVATKADVAALLQRYPQLKTEAAARAHFEKNGIKVEK